ncbi:MAG: SIMPL domain-containing protein [Gammaproteobacteria bacterium]|nr:SIMPL domain-containing protein [Gammaproteobacteria bacterium]
MNSNTSKNGMVYFKHIFQFLLLTLLLLPLASQAHDAASIHYQVTETKMVESDLLVVTINVQFKAQDAGAAAEQTNKAALQVIEMAQAIEGISITSGDYQTWSQKYGKKSMNRLEWIVRQTLTMETKYFGQLLGRLGEIQQAGGTVQSLAYTVSPKRKREIEDQLKVKAVGRFRERASDYAEAAGKARDQWELLVINVGEQQDKPIMPISRGMFAMESNQAVTAPAGTNTLSATVSGAIALTEKQVNFEEKIQSLTEKVVEQLK